MDGVQKAMLSVLCDICRRPIQRPAEVVLKNGSVTHSACSDSKLTRDLAPVECSVCRGGIYHIADAVIDRQQAMLTHRECLDQADRAKCAHCSQPLDDDLGFLMGGDRFHVHCLRRLMTDDTIRLSQALGRRSRDLIEQSRRRIHGGHGWPPVDSS
jgi:hypothetical protein